MTDKISDRQVRAALKRVAGSSPRSATVTLTYAQLGAFVALVLAVIVVSLAPVVVTGLMGRTVPDSLIAVSDKTVTGLVGVLGTLVGVMWQQQPRLGLTPPATGKPEDPIHNVQERE